MIYHSRSLSRALLTAHCLFLSRLLREHAKKAMKEEKVFLRSLRAEAKAKEDG